MSLILPGGPQWAHCTDNLASTPSFAAPCTAITAGGSNTKGSATQLLSAITHDVEYIRIGIAKFYQDASDSSALLDILTDPAGGANYNVLIPDLLAGCTSGGAGSGASPVAFNYWYEFPIWIPAGSTVAARAQTALSSPGTSYVLVQAFGGNAHPASWWCGQRVTAIGINASTSRGVTHTPGNGSWSSWADLGSALDADCGALQFAIQGQGSSSFGQAAYHWQFGVSGQPISQTILFCTTSNEARGQVPTGPIFHNFPAGTQFQQRAFRPSGTTYDHDAAVYAVH